MQGQNKKMSEYSSSERGAILDAMQNMEGYKVGKTTTLQARFGGMFDGPESGYPVMLHGKEMVLPDFKSRDLLNATNEATKQNEELVLESMDW